MPQPNTLIKALVGLLVAEGLGVQANPSSAQWLLAGNFLPEKPDRVAVVMRAGGLPDNPKWVIDTPQIQVMVRGGVGETLEAEEQIDKVKQALVGIDPTTLGDYGDLWGIVQIGGIVPIGFDTLGRPMFSLNLQLWLEPNEAGNREVIA